MSEARIETNVGRTYDVANVTNPSTLAFLDQEQTRDFVQSRFEGGTIAIQENDGPTLDVKTQEEIWKNAPVLLTHACLNEFPITQEGISIPDENLYKNLSPEQAKLFQRSHNSAAMQSEQERAQKNPLNFLKPGSDPQSLEYYESRTQRETKGIGLRLLKKLCAKAIKEGNSKYPFPQLHEYNGVIIGVPSLANYSYTDLLKELTPYEVAQLVRYEAQYKLLDREDIFEIKRLILKDPRFAFELSVSYDVLKYIPISDPVATALEMNETTFGEVVIRKLQEGLLDEDTLIQASEAIPLFADLAKTLKSRPGLAEKLSLSAETMTALGLSSEETAKIITQQAQDRLLSRSRIDAIVEAVIKKDDLARILTGDKTSKILEGYATLSPEDTRIFVRQAVLEALLDPETAQVILDYESLEQKKEPAAEPQEEPSIKDHMTAFHKDLPIWLKYDYNPFAIDDEYEDDDKPVAKTFNLEEWDTTDWIKN